MIEINYGETAIRKSAADKVRHAQEFADMREGVEALRHVELTYVSYDDQLSDEFIDAYLADDYEKLDEVEQYYWEQRVDSVERYLVDIASEYEIEDLEELQDSDPDEFDSLRWVIEEKDEANLIRDLVRNTPNQLFRLPIQTGFTYNSLLFDEDQAHEALREVVTALTSAGVPATAAFRWARQTLNECGDSIHDYYTLDVIWYGDIETVAGLQPGDTVTFTDPYLVMLDRGNGAGMDGEITATVTVTIDEDHMPHLDRTGFGYGWDEVAGLSHGAYGNSPRVTKAVQA